MRGARNLARRPDPDNGDIRDPRRFFGEKPALSASFNPKTGCAPAAGAAQMFGHPCRSCSTHVLPSGSLKSANEL
jgi:hypothetical protein